MVRQETPTRQEKATEFARGADRSDKAGGFPFAQEGRLALTALADTPWLKEIPIRKDQPTPAKHAERLRRLVATRNREKQRGPLQLVRATNLAIDGDLWQFQGKPKSSQTRNTGE